MGWSSTKQLGRAVAAVLSLTSVAAMAEQPVVVTIKPVHSIAAAVMRGMTEPGLLIDGAGSPHTFTMKPSDAKRINEAKVFFRVSDALEPFTGKLVKALPKSVRVVTLEAVPGLTLHPLRTGGTFEAHDHAKGGKHAGHDHGHGKGGTEAVDGHIWLDPGNAALIADHLANVLGEVFPAEAARLKTNAAAFARDAEALAGELSGVLQPVAGRPYIVFHDAYQYFERRFGLTPAGSVTVSPDVPPSAKRLTELRRKIQALNAACVFAEPQFTPRIIDTVLEGTKARKGVLDPLGAAIPAGADHYGKLMRSLAADLKACLANPA